MSGYAADANLPPEATDPKGHLINKPFSRSALATKLREVLDANEIKLLVEGRELPPLPPPPFTVTFTFGCGARVLLELS